MLTLTIEADFLCHKETFPFSAYIEELRRNKVHQLIQFLLGNLTSVTGDNTASAPGKPYLCGICSWLSLGYMNMNRLI